MPAHQTNFGLMFVELMSERHIERTICPRILTALAFLPIYSPFYSRLPVRFFFYLSVFLWYLDTFRRIGRNTLLSACRH